jgi:predicted HTH transcriptional regulator
MASKYTDEQVKVLGFVKDNGAGIPGAVARGIGTNVKAATKILKELVAAGALKHNGLRGRGSRYLK